MTHPSWTVKPAAGPTITLTVGGWNGDPAVAIFVGDSDPAVLLPDQVAALTSQMIRLLDRKP